MGVPPVHFFGPMKNNLDYIIESIPHTPDPRAAQNPWLAPVFPLILSTLIGLLCLRAAGTTLGLFLGGLLLIVLITGPVIAAESTWLGRSLATAGIIHGLSAVWFYAVIHADLDLSLWAASYLTLAVTVIAIAAFATLLKSTFHLGPIGGGAIATLLSMAWLTWPIWLSPALHAPHGGRIAAWLIPAHPAFALNTMLGPILGYWAEQGIAYNLTNLGDDIGYTMPDGILWCILLHLGFASACIGIAWLCERNRGTVFQPV